MRIIRKYAADAGGSHDDRLGTSVVKELSNGALFGQIEFFVRTNDEVPKATGSERPNHRRAHQAAVPGHVDARILRQFHGPTRGGCKP